MPRIWVSQPGISHSNANGTPETVSSPKRRSRTATATAKRKQQQKAKHKTKCKFFAVYFCFALLFFYVHLWQNANSNVQQQTTRASRRVCGVFNVCVALKPLLSLFPQPSLCHFAAAWVLSLLLLLARQFEQPTNCI